MGELRGTLAGVGSLKGTMQGVGKLSGRLSLPEGTRPPEYAGPYTITPTRQAQTIQTEGFILTDNLTVEPIPNNYGLITYNGGIITVS